MTGLKKVEITPQEWEAQEAQEQASALEHVEHAYQAIESAIESLTAASQGMHRAGETFSSLKGSHGKINRAVGYLTKLQGALYAEHRAAKLSATHSQELIVSSPAAAVEAAKGQLRAALKAAGKGAMAKAIAHMNKVATLLGSLPPGSLSTVDQVKKCNKSAFRSLRAGHQDEAVYLIGMAIKWLRKGTVKL